MKSIIISSDFISEVIVQIENENSVKIVFTSTCEKIESQNNRIKYKGIGLDPWLFRA